MRICQVSAELAPFAKTGGLGDVVAALTRWLGRAGHDVRTFLPLYSSADFSAGPLHPVDFLQGIEIRFGPHRYTASISTTRLPGSEHWIYLVDCPALYRRDGSPYQDPGGQDWPDNALRFGLLCKVAAALAPQYDVLHCNDWPAALAPVYAPRAKSLLTIHNLAFQGNFEPSWLARLGLPESPHAPGESIVDFCLKTLADLVVLSQQIACPTQDRRSGFYSSPDKRDDFVPQLPRRQAGFCIVGADEVAEQIRVCYAIARHGLTSYVDNALGNLMIGAERTPKMSVSRDWQPDRRPKLSCAPRDNVMHHQHQYILLLTQPQQLHSQQHPSLQIEGLLRFLRGNALRLG